MNSNISPIRTPGIRLKSLNWTKLDNRKIVGTIWKEINEEEEQVEILDNDWKSKVEEIFSEKNKTKVNKEAANNNDPNKKQKITFLNSRRSQNIDIALKGIKLTSEVIKTAIFECDINVLSRDALTELKKIVPMEDEIKMIKQFESKKDELANAERFLTECSEIDNYSERLDSLYTKSSYDELYDDASSLITSIKNASFEVKSSYKVKHLLSIILCLGNYLNTGQRGGAYGFKLNAITMLIFTKSTVDNRNYSLMHFLVDFVETKYPDLLNLNEDMPSVTDAGKVNMKDINVIMSDINFKLNKVEKTIEKTKENYKKKLKEIFLNDYDAYYDYIKDEIKEEENVEKDENEETSGKKKKGKFSFIKKFKKNKKNAEKNKNKKNNEITEEDVIEENDTNISKDENPINNEQLVEKEDITDLTNLLTDEEILKKEIESYEIDVNKEKFINEILKRYNDKFIPIMQSFYYESRTSYEKLKNFLKEANEDFANLCKSFGEDPDNTEPSELFTLFNDFWDQFLTAKKENAHYKEVKRREAERERKLKEKKEQGQGQGQGQRQREGQEEIKERPPLKKKQSVNSDIIDSIINSIRTGSAFAPSKRRSRSRNIKGSIIDEESDGSRSFLRLKDADTPLSGSIRNQYRFKQLQHSLDNLNKCDNKPVSNISLNVDDEMKFHKLHKLNIDNFNSRSIVELSSLSKDVEKSLCKLSDNENYRDANI